MKISRENINEFCRTCLAELNSLEAPNAGDEKHHIHEEEHLAHWIATCTALAVNENDSLPKFLCGLCYDKLLSFHEFRDLTARSWRLLTNIVEEKDKHEELERNQFDEILIYETMKVEVLNENGVLERQIENNIEQKQANSEDQQDGNRDAIDEGNVDENKKWDSEKVNPPIKVMVEKSAIPTLRNEVVKTDSLLRLFDEVDTTDSVNGPIKRRKYALKYVCEYCQRRYISQENLKVHVRGVHLGLDPFECRSCELTFKWSYQINTHMRAAHSEKEVMSFKCPHEGCGKLFTREDSLKKHYRLKHTAEKEIVCEFEGCGKVFTHNEYYKKHYRDKHTNQPDCKYICEDCGYTFKTRDLLQKHRCKQVPEEKYPFKCEHCGKRYTSLAVFKGHILRHSGVKKFECTHCGAKKTTQDELNKHINYHTKERQWPCPLCPKVFNSSTTLGKHDRVVHKRIKRYVCRFCDQRFGKPDGLKHHEMRHTGERPHACSLCSRRFIQVVALRAHLKTHGKIGEVHMPAPKEPTNRVKIVENLKIE